MQNEALFLTTLPIKSNLIRFIDQKNTEQQYSCHGNDALFVAQELFKTNSILKYTVVDNLRVPYCIINNLACHSFMRDLIQRGYRIEIYEFNKKFDLAKQASPGNITEMEDLLYANSDLHNNSVILALCVETRKEELVVGVALTDASTSYSIQIAEFVDKDTFSNLQSMIVQRNIKEVLMSNESSFENDRVTHLLQQLNIVVTAVPKLMFKTDGFLSTMDMLLNGDLSLKSMGLFELNQAMSATSCLVSYLRLGSDDANRGVYSIKEFNHFEYMRLDLSAVNALNLVPSPTDTNSYMSLFGVLNRTKTAQGSRLLSQWIKQPLLTLSAVNERHDFVELFCDQNELRDSISGLLANFPDLHRLAKKFARKKGRLEDVIRVYQVIKSLPIMIQTLNSYDGDKKALLDAVFLSKIKDFYNGLGKLEELVEHTIDLEAADHHQYLIKADFNQELHGKDISLELKSKIDASVADLKAESEKVAFSINLDSKKVKFEHTPQYGHHLRVSRADAASVRQHANFIELRTQKAGILFTTTNLQRLSNLNNDLLQEYKNLSVNMQKEIIAVVAGYFPILEDLNSNVAQLDVLVGFACAAVYAPTRYVRPMMNLDGEIQLIKCRHPCIELQEDCSFIENDTVLRSSDFHIITGPNMGGKSTYIRQVGVAVLMAQIGSFVPCESASIRIVDGILARVGAGDSQLKGISTFMSEMLETSQILNVNTADKVATDKSLIIIDELGRGTSTKDGYGLASAIAQHIATKIKASTLFATHFHEITTLETALQNVRNYHVQAHISEKQLTLLYKVVKGACDQSFGINVAQLAQFPLQVIQVRMVNEAC